MKRTVNVGFEIFHECASRTLEQVDLLQDLYEKHKEHMTNEWKENLLSVINLTLSHASMLFEEIVNTKGDE
jgi:hypothetical protein